MKTLPIIGSKFVGPNAYFNQATKEYWEVLPPLTKDDVKLQKALISMRVGSKLRTIGVAATLAVAAVTSTGAQAQSQEVKVCYFGGTNQYIVVPKDQPCPTSLPQR